LGIDDVDISRGRQDEIPQSSHKKWGCMVVFFDFEGLWSPFAYLFSPSLPRKECKRPLSSSLFNIL